MASSRTLASSSHGRLHRRGNSSTSSITPHLSPLTDSAPVSFHRTETPRVKEEDPCDDPIDPAMAEKLKPYLRKLAPGQPGLDLSKSFAENQSYLANLGLNIVDDKGELIIELGGSRMSHSRTNSNNSYTSYSSGLQRPNPPYMSSMRQSSRPHTPPVSKSTPASILGSEAETDDILTEKEWNEGVSYRQTYSDLPRLNTGSASRLASRSQSSLSLASPVLGASRSRGDAVTSPSSTRPSLDKALGFIRRESPLDPVSRAQQIAAARLAYNEKEEAKERKRRASSEKAAIKRSRKQIEENERRRRYMEYEATYAEAEMAEADIMNMNAEEFESIRHRFSEYHASQERSQLPTNRNSANWEKRGEMPDLPYVSRSKAAKGRWATFLAWLKTRFLRISHRIHIG